MSEPTAGAAADGDVAAPLAVGRVFVGWWPLAASWLLMGVELPAVSAVIARLAHPSINLASDGGIVFPLALLIEAPIIMLLATSTALSRDWASYVKIRRFTHLSGGALTLLHIVVAFTPLYDFIAVSVLGAPPEIIAPGRLGLQLMTPWAWAIAARRFQQGVLIRFGHSGAVGAGTVIRLLSGGTVLAIGFWLGTLPGVAVGTAAAATGVVAEAIYVAIRVQRVLREQLRSAPAVETPLTYRALIAFHTPLALTSLLHLVAMPIGSAAMGRMPLSLQSLAVWPVINGLGFVFRSVGMAYTEVVVVMIDRFGSTAALKRFAHLLAGTTIGLLAIVAVTPLGGFWFAGVSGLPAALAALAGTAIWIAIPTPGLAAWQSLNQGFLLHARRTRAISEAVAVGLVVNLAGLALGIATGRFAAIYVALGAHLSGNLVQTAWLWFRARPLMRGAVSRRESEPAA